MEYVQLGKSGLKVSRICLGTMTYGSKSWRPWVLDEEESRPFIHRALELGINFMDTADMYSVGRSEEILGRTLHDLGRRKDVIIATKVFHPMGDGPNDAGLSRRHIMDAMDASLRRLKTDYVDLYQIHRFDPGTPMEETLAALDDVVRAGKARYLGASSMAAWQFCKMLQRADQHGWTRFITMQNHYNLAYREEEREMIPLCNDEGIGLLPWSPLARGFLCGTRPRGTKGDTQRARTDDLAERFYAQTSDHDVLDAVTLVARERGVPQAVVALAWLLGRRGVTAPIIGATKMYHLEDAVGAVSFKLTTEERKRLEKPYQPHRVIGH